jgi:hypothetical protein
MATFSNKFGANAGKKGQIEYTCETCDYICSKKYTWERHLLTSKHLKATNGNNSATNLGQKGQTYLCSYCDKQYSNRSGLWRHNKKCIKEHNVSNDPNDTEDIKDKDLIMALIKDNSELKNLIIKVIEKDTTHNNTNNNTTNNTNTNNSHNKTFNLSVYLNETCKDAIDINDFVKSIQVKLEDLEYTGRVGYVDGVSNIIINSLNSMNTPKRPIHCTDEKREVLYIKNDGEWIKETDDKPILTKAIKTIANENIKAISDWRKEYPDCTDANSKKNNLYLKIVSNSMSGITKEECDKNYNKIIRNIVKKTIIDKETC